MRKTLLFWNIATMVIALLFFPQVGKSQYPYIKIADVVVNVSNQDNVTSDYISGTIRYDSATRTLILQDATIVAPPPSPDPYYQELVVFVAGQYKDFNIKLIGNNVITGATPLFLYEGSFQILGPGTLTLNATLSGINCDIDAYSLRISESAHVNINVPWSPSSGIKGGVILSGETSGEATVLSIDSSSLIIDANKSIVQIGDLQLDGCFIAYPSNAYYEHTSQTIVDENGHVVMDHLEILAGTVDVPSHTVSDWQVWGANGGIRMEQLPDSQTVEVLNLLGQTVRQFKTSATNVFVPLKAGVYLVRVNNQTVKVVVK